MFLNSVKYGMQPTFKSIAENDRAIECVKKAHFGD